MRIFRSFTIVALAVLGIAGEARAQLSRSVYASGFSNPVAFVPDPTDRAVQFVVEQGGRIRVVRNGALLSTDFLNLTTAIAFAGEQGLLGLAFSPDYVTSGRFFVNFTNTAGNTVVARFRRSANPLVADASSRFDLRWGGAGGSAFIAQPFSNHNGGNLVFGPDGFLYIGLGDGGSGNDPGNRSQTPSELLGKMLRVDVNVSDSDSVGYRVPSTNPFVGAAGTRPEIWSFGFRNPWRYSFDDPTRGGTGALVIGDVGQDRWEEIDYEPSNRGGRNYGWRYREGAHDNVTSLPPAYLPLTDPIFEYDHSTGASVTGGYVYRGAALGPAYRGRYFFADFSLGRVWSVALAIDPVTGDARATNLVEHTGELGPGNVSSFGLDADGELYIVSYSSGTILKVLGQSRTPRPAGDFDGDGKADLAVYRPSNGHWYIRQSRGNYSYGDYLDIGWGLLGDVPLHGDFDGDGKTDPAVYRPSTGSWYILNSSSGYTTWTPYQWGVSGDTPLAADFDGDGQTDLVFYRPSNGTWYIRYSSSGYSTANATSYQWGLPGDTPLVTDFDGDGKTDLVVYRGSTGEWFVRYSSSQYSYATWTSYQWGLSGDIPLVADFDGDRKADLLVYRPSTAYWYVRFSSSQYSYVNWTSYQWGLQKDTPVSTDFDGDGRTDLAVWRPSTGEWFIRFSSTAYSYAGFGAYQWGQPGDVPLP